METWFLLNDDFSQQEMMTQRSFVFPNVVSDHDGIRRKNPNQFCFQILCRITSRSDTQIVNSKCVSKFCVGSHQHLTQKSKPVVLPNFVSDPINIRHKKNKADCVSKFCVGSRQHPTQKSKPVVLPNFMSDPNFVSDPISIRHKKSKAGGVSTFWIESHQPLTQKWKLPSFKCRLKNLCVSTFCVGSHQDPTQNENYLVTCIPRTFGGDHVFLEALDKSAIQKLQRGETNLSQIPSGQTQEF